MPRDDLFALMLEYTTYEHITGLDHPLLISDVSMDDPDLATGPMGAD
jgi:hypothetical protein